jgi:hypothetical protein
LEWKYITLTWRNWNEEYWNKRDWNELVDKKEKTTLEFEEDSFIALYMSKGKSKMKINQELDFSLRN